MNEDYPPKPGDLFSGTERAKGTLSEESVLVPLERPRGILTPTDREYLCGQTKYEHAQTEANRKQKIRQRVTHSFQDYLLLSWLLDSEERNKIFQEEMDEELLHDSLKAMITFVYLGLQQDETHLERIIENGVYVGANLDKGGRRVGEATDVDVSIDIEYNPDVEDLLQRLDSGEADQLTPAEIGVLVRAGELDNDDLDELADAGPEFPGVYAGEGHHTDDDQSNPSDS